MEINERFLPGTVVIMHKPKGDTEDARKENLVNVKYVVIRQFRHFLLVARSSAYQETILNADLIVNGKATQWNMPAAGRDTDTQIKYEHESARKRRKNA